MTTIHFLFSLSVVSCYCVATPLGLYLVTMVPLCSSKMLTSALIVQVLTQNERGWLH